MRWYHAAILGIIIMVSFGFFLRAIDANKRQQEIILCTDVCEAYFVYNYTWCKEYGIAFDGDCICQCEGSHYAIIKNQGGNKS